MPTLRARAWSGLAAVSLGVLTLPIGLWAKMVENKFKAMEVAEDYAA